MKEKLTNHFSGNFKLFFDKYLQNIKAAGGDEFKAICPFPSHKDNNPSFFFNNQTGQYYCHGCGKKGDFLHFYGKINSLDTRRDFGKILWSIANDFGIPWEQQKSRLVKAYDYVDAAGELLFQVCRMEPKKFRQRRPDGNGGWIWKLNGIEPVLYRLPEIIKAKEVLIVEGEKDVDNLINLGFTATTNPMGAKKWQDSYTETLKGKEIVLIPDNDNEGREHMTRVAGILNGHAASLKLLNLPDLPSKGDVSDFIAKFQSTEQAAERLAILIENAEPYEPPKQMSLDDIVMDLGQFCQIEMVERKTYLNPWLKASSINLISGWRGTGKTWFALSIVDAISRGEKYGPWLCVHPVRCLFLDGEMPPEDIQERKNDLNISSAIQIYSDALANQYGLPRAHLGNESWRQKMRQILTTRKIKLWVADNLASLAPGLDENSRKDWDPINQWLLELRFAGISTIMLHHTNKDGGQRGTSAREDNIDISITLKSPHDYTPDDGARFVVHFSKARVRTGDLSLITDTEFRLVQDENGQCIWSFGGVKKERRREVLQMLDEGYKQSEIVENLGISKGHVSKIKTKAIKDGYLTNENKLTQTGFLAVKDG